MKLSEKREVGDGRERGKRFPFKRGVVWEMGTCSVQIVFYDLFKWYKELIRVL